MALTEEIPTPKDPEMRNIIDVIRRQFQKKEYPSRRQKTVSSATYSVDGRDEVIHVDYTATGAVTITLPSATLFQGRPLVIYDRGNNAAANNITVTGVYTISTNKRCVTFASDGANWYVEAIG
jgi:hypothetical protein